MTCFIEQCFRRRILCHPGGKAILNKWEYDKKAYRDRTALTAFDFQHFSMHDESHSIKILNYIELILGRNRIEKDLSLGDLWLLLQCAYFHDIGMTLTKKQRTDLWINDKKFKRHITDRLKDNAIGAHRDIFEAAHYYKYIDDLLSGKRTPEILDEEFDRPTDWPETLNDKIRLLMTDYIRQHHAEYCKEALEEIVIKDSEFFDGAVEKRLYELVAIISAQHTKEFESIFTDLQYQEIAFGNIYIHPQFIAALLRIGDVLDIDNNRFNVRVLDHVGTLPPTSLLHLEKHRSLTNYNVSSCGITAVARSNDLDVCKITRDWFNWIESEVRDLKYHWNTISPVNLNYCRLKFCDLKVFLNGNEFTSRNVNRFSFDSRKMQKLLIGDSIYSCKLDCVREYIQNAMDASKVKLWEILKHENAEYLFKNSMHCWPWSMTLPCDLKEDVFNQFPINIELSLCRAIKRGENDKIRITIRDYGIGMDSACVKDITTIGKGWRNRREYQDVFRSAPKWLRPTGGFGIGIQSAFMITDQVVYCTRSENEPYGHIIRLDSPSRGGNVSDEIQNGLSQGTKVEFEVDAFKFLDASSLGLSNTVQEYVRSKMNNTVAAMFSDQYLLELAGSICRGYIEEQVPNSLFPIRFSYQGQKPVLLPSISYYEYEYDAFSKEITGKFPLSMHSFIDNKDAVSGSDSDESYAYCIIPKEQIPMCDGRGQKIILWNRAYMDCVAFTFLDMPLNHPLGSSATITFKDILVPDHVDKAGIPNVIYRYNLLGQTAGDALLVSRARLSRDFESIFRDRLSKHLKFALTLLIPHLLERLNSNGEIARDDYKRMLFALISQTALQDSFNEFVEKTQIHYRTDSSYLNTLYCIQKKSQSVEDETQYHIVNCDSQNAINMLIEIFDDYRSNSSKELVLYSLSHIEKSSELTMSPDQFHDDSLISQYVDFSLIEEQSSRQESRDSAIENNLRKFFLQSNDLEQAQTSEELSSLLDNIYIFSEEWEHCFSNILTDRYTVIEKEKSSFVLPVKVDTQALPQYFKLTRYHFVSHRPTSVDSMIMHTRVLVENKEYQERYPYLSVKAVPFPKHEKDSSFSYAHIIPGKEILDRLSDIGSHHTEITKEAIKQALSNSSGLLSDFRRLVRWTYMHQYHKPKESSCTYQEIEQAYFAMLLDLIKEERAFVE